MYCYKLDGDKKIKCEFCVESLKPVQLYCNKTYDTVSLSRYLRENVKAPKYCPKQS
jgi:hypothetical protein